MQLIWNLADFTTDPVGITAIYNGEKVAVNQPIYIDGRITNLTNEWRSAELLDIAVDPNVLYWCHIDGTSGPLRWYHKNLFYGRKLSEAEVVENDL